MAGFLKKHHRSHRQIELRLLFMSCLAVLCQAGAWIGSGPSSCPTWYPSLPQCLHLLASDGIGIAFRWVIRSVPTSVPGSDGDPIAREVSSESLTGSLDLLPSELPNKSLDVLAYCTLRCCLWQHSYISSFSSPTPLSLHHTYRLPMDLT